MTFLESFYLFLTAKIPTRITIPKDTMVPTGATFSSKIFSENNSRAIANSSKALHSIISLKLGLRFIYFKNDFCSLLISIVPFEVNPLSIEENSSSENSIHGKLFNQVCDEIYVVNEGETLHTISDKCGDPYIVEENPHIQDPDDVFPGLVIKITPRRNKV